MAAGTGRSKSSTQRSRPSFLTRVATDDAEQLERPSSTNYLTQALRHAAGNGDANMSRAPDRSQPGVEQEENARTPLLGLLSKNKTADERRSAGRSRSSRERDPLLRGHSHREYHATDGADDGGKGGELSAAKEKPIRAPDRSSKLGTFSGVFVPTSLNVLSILMFLRFGFILGQSGVIGMLAMLVICYLITLVTTLSISAIATNGTVRGGGAYYLISRSLGPEFGGSIGLVLYLGFVLNTGLNAVGLVDCLIQNFGVVTGSRDNWMPEGFWWNYLWSTCVLVFCTMICLAGSGVFARASNGLLAVLLVSTLSIPLSALIMRPFESRRLGIEYTGPSLETLRGNLMPRFTRGAAGSEMNGKENYQDLFGILFPATGGIFAGASMSGDLKNPSRAIPKGTLSGLALTFALYLLVILSMATTITRASFYRNVNVIQDTNMSAMIILLGEFATALFSSLMGVIGSAKLLQALARDTLLPGLSIFSQGTKKSDEPTLAILITHAVAQVTMLCNINQIASFVTMTYLMTFLVTNLACFLLKVSSAPNFRPSFHYFNWKIAAAGTVVSGLTMFFVDGLYASGCVGILVILFLLIHYTTPPKSWGDVGQNLIYHQVRKYLLRLRQEHVKYWRPQILLLINNPRSHYQLVQFCNHMKKGALYVLGHVIVSQDFEVDVQEARKQQAAWTKYVDSAKVKAFINIAVAPTVEWGARNIVMSAGLGGMRPNIAVLGFYNLARPREISPSPQASRQANVAAGIERDVHPPSGAGVSVGTGNEHIPDGPLPTDSCKFENGISAQSYVTILEDLLIRLRINVAVAKGFHRLEIPSEHSKLSKYIDLWPIQMSAEIVSEGSENPNVLTTNFDTYTLILQLGCILNTVPAWKKSFALRVAVFVEYESDVEEEGDRVKSLLENLRIEAEVLVFFLASGDLRFYEIFVNGKQPSEAEITSLTAQGLQQQDGIWQDIGEDVEGRSDKSDRDRSERDKVSTPGESPRPGPLSRLSPFFRRVSTEQTPKQPQGLKEFVSSKRRYTMSGLGKLGVSLGMRTHRLSFDLINNQMDQSPTTDESDSSGYDDALSDFEEDIMGESNAAAAPELPFRASNTGPDVTPGRESEEMTPTKQPSSIKNPPQGQQGSSSLSHPSALSKQSSPSPSGPPRINRATSNPTLRSENRPSSSSNPRPAPSLLQPFKNITNVSRPRAARQISTARFTSNPVPKTQLAPSETSGPSIMFADSPPSSSTRIKRANIPPSGDGGLQPHPHRSSSNTSYQLRQGSTTSAPASGYPSTQSQPLSFNDLPCRAQHLILNELIRQQSHQTAVVFTTLPSPLKGTCHSEVDSLRYLGDLELLCRDLPPTLLVHANSMTVTTNL